MDDLEGFEGDAFDAIQKFSERQTVDEEFNASQDFQDKAPRGSPVKGDAIKRLEDERWHNHLDHNEREVVRRAKADDEFAKEELYKCFHKTVLDIAGDPKHGGPEFKDLVAAGAVGLWEAAKRFDPAITASMPMPGSSSRAKSSIWFMTGTRRAASWKPEQNARTEKQAFSNVPFTSNSTPSASGMTRMATMRMVTTTATP
jgi:hypothetical protein